MNTKKIIVFLMTFLSVPTTMFCMDRDVEEFLELIKPWKGQEELIKQNWLEAKEKARPIVVTLNKDKEISAMFKSKSIILNHASKTVELGYTEFLSRLAFLPNEETSETEIPKKTKRRWCCCS